MGKCTVDLVTGFLDSGKSSLIKSILSRKSYREEVIVIQCESGKEVLDLGFINKKRITVKDFSINYEMNVERILRLLKFYDPDRIIIECSVSKDINDLLDILNNKELKPYLRIGNITNIIDVTTLNMMLKNMSTAVLPSIQASNLIILNKCNKISERSVNEHITTIETLNLHCHIVVNKSRNDLQDILDNGLVSRLLG
ncbi:MAG: GTP-binding protein [Clostridium perfringens]|nr:GTP-binding protein [Clostridium perfringens]